MSKNKGRAGTHTTIIEAARPVVKLLEKRGRVSRGVITARRWSTRSIHKSNSTCRRSPRCSRFQRISPATSCLWNYSR
jgi:hypothetical protein